MSNFQQEPASGSSHPWRRPSRPLTPWHLHSFIALKTLATSKSRRTRAIWMLIQCNQVVEALPFPRVIIHYRPDLSLTWLSTQGYFKSSQKLKAKLILTQKYWNPHMFFHNRYHPITFWRPLILLYPSSILKGKCRLCGKSSSKTQSFM